MENENNVTPEEQGVPEEVTDTGSANKSIEEQLAELDEKLGVRKDA